MRLARRTTGDQMAAHRKLDRRRDDLCAGGLRKRVSEPLPLANLTFHRLTVCFANGPPFTPFCKVKSHSIRKFNSNQCVVGAALLAETTIRTMYVPADKGVRSPGILIFSPGDGDARRNRRKFPKKNPESKSPICLRRSNEMERA